MSKSYLKDAPPEQAWLRSASGLEVNVPHAALPTPVQAVHRKNRLVVCAAALLVGFIALSVVTGWFLNVRILESWLPDLATMKANTAFCLAMTAGALWLTREEGSREGHSVWAWVLITVVSSIALITLCEYAFDWNVGIDQLIFKDLEHAQTSYPPGRFAPGTGVCFILLSAALALVDSWPRTSHGLTLGAVLIALVGLIGYLYDLPTLYGAARYTSMALHTIVAFLALCAGVLAARPERGLTVLLAQTRPQGSTSRWVLVGAIVFPIILGSLALSGQRRGWYGSEFTLATFSVFLIVLTVALVWLTGAERQRVEARRVEAEKALRYSELQFRALAETIPHLAWMADETGHIFWYNRRWYEYTGTTFEEMEGWGWEKVHDPVVLPNVLRQWIGAINTGQPFAMTFPLRGTDGAFRTFLTRVEPMADTHGRVMRWFGTNTDITEQRKTEEELRRINRELEEFAYVASHDLQEPLRMVNINTQLILRSFGGNDAKLNQHAAYVRQGVVRMETLIHDLLAFSRVVNAADLQAETADLSVALNDALSVLQNRIEESKAVITAPALPIVCGDTQQMSQVFQNLVSNSLKYSRVGIAPEIGISVEEDGERWIVSVRDNGIGFEPRYAERIFGLFKRLHKDEYPGTGLGLAICQRIVERYGGRMWAEGRPGEGSTFSFSVLRAR